MAECRRFPARAATVALAVLLSAPEHRAAAQSPQLPAGAAQVDQGRRLFEGELSFRNGGPPCGACHTIATLRFPNGGTLGPDLSGIAQTLGPEGTDTTLQTLFFPTMQPLYEQRPLTPPERQALAAFLAQAAGASTRDRDTASLAGLALAGLLALSLATWRAGRGRLRGVRAPLVARSRQGARS